MLSVCGRVPVWVLTIAPLICVFMAGIDMENESITARMRHAEYCLSIRNQDIGLIAVGRSALNGDLAGLAARECEDQQAEVDQVFKGIVGVDAGQRWAKTAEQSDSVVDHRQKGKEKSCHQPHYGNGKSGAVPSKEATVAASNFQHQEWVSDVSKWGAAEITTYLHAHGVNTSAGLETAIGAQRIRGVMLFELTRTQWLEMLDEYDKHVDSESPHLGESHGHKSQVEAIFAIVSGLQNLVLKCPASFWEARVADRFRLHALFVGLLHAPRMTAAFSLIFDSQSAIHWFALGLDTNRWQEIIAYVVAPQPVVSMSMLLHTCGNRWIIFTFVVSCINMWEQDVRRLWQVTKGTLPLASFLQAWYAETARAALITSLLSMLHWTVSDAAFFAFFIYQMMQSLWFVLAPFAGAPT